MNEILQGTTPSLEISFDQEDFLITDAASMRLVFLHNGEKKVCGLNDVTVDSEANSVIYEFTEADTLAMDPDKPIIYQARFKLTNGKVVGTEKMRLTVADLIDEEVMG